MIMKILDIFRTGKAEAGEDPEAMEAKETAAAAPEVLQAPAVEDLEAQDAAAAAPEVLRGQGMECPEAQDLETALNELEEELEATAAPAMEARKPPEAQDLETILNELEEDLEAQDAAAAAQGTARAKEEELEAWKKEMLRRLRNAGKTGGGRGNG